MDVMSTKYAKFSIIKMAVMAIIEEHLVIYGRRSTYGGEMVHGFMPNIKIHIY